MKTSIMILFALAVCAGAQEPVPDLPKGVTPPTLLYKASPEYTLPAWKVRRQGVVLLYIDVNPQGRAENVRVVRGLGLGLDEQAVGTVINLWRFQPGLKDGKPVTVGPFTIEVNFRLADK